MSTTQYTHRLQRFPPKSRDLIRPHFTAVCRLINGGTKTAKELRTLLSRQICFLRFCNDHGLLEFIFPISKLMMNVPLEALNDTLAMYAIYLATGNTIYSQMIKGTTMELYLLAAASIIQKLDQIPDRDARKTPDGKVYKGIKKVIDEVKRIEKVPNRREGYTLAMHKELFEKMKFHGKDSELRCCYEWYTLGLQLGLRRSEYCQETSAFNLDKFERSPLGDARAFTINDLEFYTWDKRLITRKDALMNREKVQHVRVLFRWQKNGLNGVHRWVSRNDKNPYLCAVTALLNIVDRFIRLVGETRVDRPIAVYRAVCVKYLTSTIATKWIRYAARRVHDVVKQEELDKFSCHSLRVGACCIYFAAGYSAPFIQRALRWESDAWKRYVRDLVVTSMQMTDAFNTANTMPLM